MGLLEHPELLGHIELELVVDIVVHRWVQEFHKPVKLSANFCDLRNLMIITRNSVLKSVRHFVLDQREL